MRLLPRARVFGPHLGILSVVTVLAACSQADTSRPVGRASSSLEQEPSALVSSASGPREQVIAWGQGAGELGYSPARQEALAQGPSALSVLPNGEVIVLDRLHRRVVRIGGEGTVMSVTTASPDAEDLAADHDGAFALYSPLQSKVWIHAPQGGELGTVQVPRGLRDAQALSFGPSRRVIVRTALQEMFSLGSPHAATSFESVLHSRSEGAARLPDATAASVQRSKDGRIDLVIVQQAPPLLAVDSKSVVLRRFEVAAHAASARIIGAIGSVVCMKVERVTDGQELEVEREATCVHAATGKRTFQVSLPATGTYVPRTELAIGGSPPRLAMIHPRAHGLAVLTYDAVTGLGKEGSAP
jgi:hypothetical protein